MGHASSFLARGAGLQKGGEGEVPAVRGGAGGAGDRLPQILQEIVVGRRRMEDEDVVGAEVALEDQDASGRIGPLPGDASR